jgi:toxin ParE1/3/4
MLVRWTQPAVDDLTQICEYTDERFGGIQARRAAIALFDGVESLRVLPNRGRPGRRANTRELVVTGLPFLIIYRLHDDAIEVTRILHSAQKWP